MNQTATNSNIILDAPILKYWNNIKDAPAKVKLKLISLLSDSLSESTPDNENDYISDKLILLKEIAGSWNGPESTDQIIDMIRENRSNRNPVEF